MTTQLRTTLQRAGVSVLAAGAVFFTGSAVSAAENDGSLGDELLYEGKSSQDVENFKELLDETKFYSVDNPSSQYSNQTAQAVKEFQQNYDLLVDGLAGPQTIGALMGLENGDQGQVVEALQEDLQAAGYYQAGLDGIFGPLTEEAVVELQNDYDVDEKSGVAGPKTYSALHQVTEGTVEEEPAQEEQQAAEEEAAQEEQQAAEEQAAQEEQQAAEEQAAQEEQQAAEEQAAQEEQQAAEEEAAQEEQQAAEEEAAQEEQQAAEEQAAQEEQQAAEEQAAQEEQQAAEEQAAQEEQQAAEEQAAQEEQQAAEEQAAQEEQQAAEEQAAQEETATSTSSDADGQTMSLEATAYTADCEGCTGVTYTGIDLNANPNKNVVAVDPDVIPLGSTVHVEGYGQAVAGDIGGAIQGERIDLHMASNAEAVNFGRQQVEVTVIDTP
ncbi:peptidoglycan-binding domain-containing protein [Salisediminibacterium halotolerans]|uniref:peptidoglycan-binding domain-containing protein n=3 Tax=Salisediminibacterium halotolerans TaxID=517425 RepID=UPI000F5029D3|nr:peptidoglycan-binding protein [Salisediminibacterium halotolerans]RPE85579.1 3D (Asp-Asp-Asp) domain-containing protein [Salisediminibacterium halotolerans]